ncbi:MAG: hypothetical protein PHH08_04370 [Candidatus ainarchaeum sp.]|nr:hypothetical protein [Candidatus ainarchaeum sp.]
MAKITRKKPVHPFKLQCGLPAGIEARDNTRKAIVKRLAGLSCRGGISDELNFGKPRKRKK